MRSSLLFIGATALALPAAASVSNGTPHRPDRNAFVDHKITDTRSLIAEVRNNPDVADRYERHFSMTRPQLLAYLRTLHRAPLAKTGEFTVYSVPPNGVVKMHHEVYRKGTPIFVDASGRPTLIAKCGNPIVTGVPVTQRTRISPVPPTSTDTVAFLPDLRDTPIDAADLLDAVPVLPDIAPAVAVGPTDLVTALSTVPTTATGAGGGLPLLGLAPLLLPIFGSHGGGGGFTPVPVPEPASFAMLAVGALAVVGRRWRRA